MSDWFKDWFNTDYYHVLYKNRNFREAEQFIEKLLDYLSLPEGAHILDLACGKGRHAIFINKLGYQVTGLDLSPNNIKAAKHFENESLSFDVHDMREMYPSNQFDAVFNLFTSFGYFDTLDDNRKVLQAIKGELKTGGIFLIDFLNVDFVRQHLVEQDQKTIDNIDFSIGKSMDDKFIRKEISFSDQGKTYQFMERVQTLDVNDLEELLTTEGFEIIEMFGDYELSPFRKSSSERLIIKASVK